METDTPDAIEVDPALDVLLKHVSGLDVLPARDYSAITPVLYACVFHDDNDQLVKAYIQRTTAAKLFLRPGTLILGFVNQRLTKVTEEGLLCLEDAFELIVEPDGAILALSQSAVDRFYRDVAFLKERATAYALAFFSAGVLNDRPSSTPSPCTPALATVSFIDCEPSTRAASSANLSTRTSSQATQTRPAYMMSFSPPTG